jgi:hypothetical protein
MARALAAEQRGQLPIGLSKSDRDPVRASLQDGADHLRHIFSIRL